MKERTWDRWEGSIKLNQVIQSLWRNVADRI